MNSFTFTAGISRHSHRSTKSNKIKREKRIKLVRRGPKMKKVKNGQKQNGKLLVREKETLQLGHVWFEYLCTKK